MLTSDTSLFLETGRVSSVPISSRPPRRRRGPRRRSFRRSGRPSEADNGAETSSTGSTSTWAFSGSTSVTTGYFGGGTGFRFSISLGLARGDSRVLGSLTIPSGDAAFSDTRVSRTSNTS